MKNPVKALADALPDKYVEVSVCAKGGYIVDYADGFGTTANIKDGYSLVGVAGYGDTIEEAANDYIRKIGGKTLVFDHDDKREIVKVAFLKE